MSDPAQLWLAAQRELMERWLAAPESAALQSEAQRWWQAVSQGASPQAQVLAQQLAALGPVFLAGAGDALFEIFGVNAARSSGATQENPQADGPHTPQPPFARWLDLAPIGYFREHQQHVQELARAMDEYRRVAERMAGTIARVHADALESLAKKVAASGEDVRDTKRLYALWIECGEQAFAAHARGEQFGRLQGELVNAGTRVRIAQQTLAEYLLKSLDLPTRAELNSVHKRLKEMRTRIETLEAELRRPAMDRAAMDMGGKQR